MLIGVKAGIYTTTRIEPLILSVCPRARLIIVWAAEFHLDACAFRLNIHTDGFMYKAGGFVLDATRRQRDGI